MTVYLILSPFENISEFVLKVLNEKPILYIQAVWGFGHVSIMHQSYGITREEGGCANKHNTASRKSHPDPFIVEIKKKIKDIKYNGEYIGHNRIIKFNVELMNLQIGFEPKTA